MQRFAMLGAVLVIAAPALAHAQADCVRRQQDNRVAGTVVGAAGGAVVGSALAGRGSHTEGAVIGGVAGAVLGNQLSRPRDPCPEGYVQRDYRYDAQDRAPPNAGGFWAGAGTSIHERIDFLEDRVRRGQADGSLTQWEARRAFRDLADLRDEQRRLRDRDGGRLNDADRRYLWDKLDNIRERIRWMRHNDQRSY